ncbi:MAG: DUF6152 family protein [Gammaproteobacteria bacterium]|jgi:hypothetical protein
MTIRSIAAKTLVSVAIALPQFDLASAHHAATMFDREQTVELVATVREFQWTSPHVWIQVQVENESGEIEEWSIEGGTPSRLYRAGWRPTTFNPGDKVTIRGNPMRDGGKAALFVGAKLEDGSTLGRY